MSNRGNQEARAIIRDDVFHLEVFGGPGIQCQQQRLTLPKPPPLSNSNNKTGRTRLMTAIVTIAWSHVRHSPEPTNQTKKQNEANNSHCGAMASTRAQGCPGDCSASPWAWDDNGCTPCRSKSPSDAGWWPHPAAWQSSQNVEVFCSSCESWNLQGVGKEPETHPRAWHANGKAAAIFDSYVELTPARADSWHSEWGTPSAQWSERWERRHAAGDEAAFHDCAQEPHPFNTKIIAGRTVKPTSNGGVVVHKSVFISLYRFLFSTTSHRTFVNSPQEFLWHLRLRLILVFHLLFSWSSPALFCDRPAASCVFFCELGSFHEIVLEGSSCFGLSLRVYKFPMSSPRPIRHLRDYRPVWIHVELSEVCLENSWWSLVLRFKAPRVDRIRIRLTSQTPTRLGGICF